MHLGQKIRHMRQVRGLTAVALAKHARVTTGFISQLERSQTVPSLQTLQRVAAALDVSLTSFFLEESQQPQVVRHRERALLHLGPDGSRLWLLSPVPPQHLELALLELPRGAVSWSTAGAQEGQQCLVVLQGTVRADSGDTTYRLEEGDSILWDGTRPYRLENIDTPQVRLLIAMAPASLWKHGGEEASPGTSFPGLRSNRKDMSVHNRLEQQVVERSSSPMMVFSYHHVKERPKLLLAMTGLTQAEFDQLLPHFQWAWDQYVQQNYVHRVPRQQQDGGGKPEATLVTIEDKLLFILYHIIICPLQEILAFEFGMGQSTANKWIPILSEVLQKALDYGRVKRT